MKPTLYLETSVINYLSAAPSRDLLVAGHQVLTREWWDGFRDGFQLYTSQLVVREAGAGRPDAAALRLATLAGIPYLDITDDAVQLASSLISRRILPELALADATHIALAAVHGIDYLLTWNCRHIANAQIRRLVESCCRQVGYEPSTVCTPEELLGE